MFGTNTNRDAVLCATFPAFTPLYNMSGFGFDIACSRHYLFMALENAWVNSYVLPTVRRLARREGTINRIEGLLVL